jgi:hypothetical protein
VLLALSLALAGCPWFEADPADTADSGATEVEPGPDCAAHPLDCDLADNDCDGEVDEGDEIEARAWLGVDGDADGWAAPPLALGCPDSAVGSGDCDDDDAAVHPEATERCDLLGDEDCDGLADCADPDCLSSCVEDCDDLVDNDGDALADCADPDCRSSCGEDCRDRVDNDGDGLRDCADEDCWGASCREQCSTPGDEDGDGLADCEDTDCSDRCTERCDGADDDMDGLVDCDDPDCGLELACWTDLQVEADGLSVRRELVATATWGTPTIALQQSMTAEALRIDGVAHTDLGAPLPCALAIVDVAATGYIQVGTSWIRPWGTVLHPFESSAVRGAVDTPSPTGCPTVLPRDLRAFVPPQLPSPAATWALRTGDIHTILTIAPAASGTPVDLRLLIQAPTTYTVHPIGSSTETWERIASQVITGEPLLSTAP